MEVVDHLAVEELCQRRARADAGEVKVRDNDHACAAVEVHKMEQRVARALGQAQAHIGILCSSTLCEGGRRE